MFFSYYLHRISNWIGLALAIAFLLVVLQVVGWVQRSLSDSGSGSQLLGQQATPVVIPNAPSGANASPTSPTPQRETPSAPTVSEIHDQHVRATEQLTEAVGNADLAMKSMTAWETEIVPLMTNEAGENIAAHQELVANLAAVVDEQRTSEPEVRDANRRIDQLKSILAKLRSASPPQPLAPMQMVEIGELHTKTMQAAEQWETALTRARAIERAARRRVFPKEQPSLREEIEAAIDEQTIADLEEDRKLAEQRRAEERRRLQEAEELARKRQAEEDAAAEQARQKEAELLARARSADVEMILAPFLQVRGVQPRKVGSASVQFRSTSEDQPMSLTALRNAGALADSIQGLKMLAKIGGNRKLPAPRWSVYSQPNNWTADDRKMLKEAQNMLRELGPTLVKGGKLSP